MEEAKKGFLPMSHGIHLSKTRCPSTTDERERMSRISMLRSSDLLCMQ
jgi:hypothetical protein